MRFKNQVTTCSDVLSDAMSWVKEVEMVDSLEELKSSRSVCGKNFQILRCWTRRLLLLRSRSSRIPNSRRRSASRSRKPQKEDRFLRGRQIAFMIYDYFRGRREGSAWRHALVPVKFCIPELPRSVRPDSNQVAETSGIKCGRSCGRWQHEYDGGGETTSDTIVLRACFDLQRKGTAGGQTSPRRVRVRGSLSSTFHHDAKECFKPSWGKREWTTRCRRSINGRAGWRPMRNSQVTNCQKTSKLAVLQKYLRDGELARHLEPAVITPDDVRSGSQGSDHAWRFGSHGLVAAR